MLAFLKSNLIYFAQPSTERISQHPLLSELRKGNVKIDIKLQEQTFTVNFFYPSDEKMKNVEQKPTARNFAKKKKNSII